MKWFQLLIVALLGLTLECMCTQIKLSENCDTESMCNDVQDDSFNSASNDDTGSICKAPGIYPDPKSDEGYYICARSENGDGLVMYFRCLSGLSYDLRTKQCLDQDDHGRSLNRIEGGGRFIGLARDIKIERYSNSRSEIGENGRNFNSDEEERVCNEPGKHKHSRSCFKYILCVPVKSSIDTFYEVERNCPEGTAFSLKYRQCSERFLRSCFRNMENLKADFD